jgi:hypothetical protein
LATSLRAAQPKQRFFKRPTTFGANPKLAIIDFTTAAGKILPGVAPNSASHTTEEIARVRPAACTKMILDFIQMEVHIGGATLPSEALSAESPSSRNCTRFMQKGSKGQKLSQGKLLRI